MAQETVKQMIASGATRRSGIATGLSTLLNLKQAFNDARRQQVWEREKMAIDRKRAIELESLRQGYLQPNIGAGGDITLQAATGGGGLDYTLEDIGGGIQRYRDRSGKTQLFRPSYTDEYRTAIEEGAKRIQGGEKSGIVIKELRSKYPGSMNAEREWTLKQIEQDTRTEVAGLKGQAIKLLKDAGYPVTEKNLQETIRQLRGR